MQKLIGEFGSSGHHVGNPVQPDFEGLGRLRHGRTRSHPAVVMVVGVMVDAAIDEAVHRDAFTDDLLRGLGRSSGRQVARRIWLAHRSRASGERLPGAR